MNKLYSEYDTFIEGYASILESVYSPEELIGCLEHYRKFPDLLKKDSIITAKLHDFLYNQFIDKIFSENGEKYPFSLN